MAPTFRLATLALSLFLFLACGPDTIILRPALDTPEQHVKNGHNLLARGKLDAADAEFFRAKTLDDGYAPAYVGLALVQGHRGNFEGGVDILNRARLRVTTAEGAALVDRGFDQLREMQSGRAN